MHILWGVGVVRAFQLSGNIIALLLGSTVIKFLVVIANVGGLVISPFL